MYPSRQSQLYLVIALAGAIPAILGRLGSTCGRNAATFTRVYTRACARSKNRANFATVGVAFAQRRGVPIRPFSVVFGLDSTPQHRRMAIVDSRRNPRRQTRRNDNDTRSFHQREERGLGRARHMADQVRLAHYLGHFRRDDRHPVQEVPTPDSQNLQDPTTRLERHRRDRNGRTQSNHG